MWSLLRTRRWLAFTALVVVAVVGFGLLSHWQWQRAEERRADKVALEFAVDRQPLTLEEVLPQPVEWTPITLTGTYDAGASLLVRQRPLDGANGFWVLTPLATDGREVWVNRGWVRAGATAGSVVAAPEPPAGVVTVTGRVRLADVVSDPAPADLPAGQVSNVVPESWGRGVPTLYVEAARSTPSDAAVTPIPLPSIDDGRNISYAVQWVIFAVIALVGWFYFLRREAREDEAKESAWASA